MDVFLNHLQSEGQHLLTSILFIVLLSRERLLDLPQTGKMRVNSPLTRHSCSVFVPGDFHLLFYFASSNDQLLGGLGGVTKSLLILCLVAPCSCAAEFAISMADAWRLLCSLWRGDREEWTV